MFPLAFGALIILVFDLLLTPLRSLTPELQALAIFYIIPDFFWDLHIIAFLNILVGCILLLFRWRFGKIELTNEKLLIHGSYDVSIWIKNIWEVEVRDLVNHRWRIKLDSNVDAVHIKFKTEKEFETFSEQLIQRCGQVESIKLKITT